MLFRLISNISFSEPLHLITTGSEEQSFLSLWRFIYQQPVYTYPHKIPFTSSYLNWLFYGFYGILTKGVLVFARLSDAWIPTIGRLISFFLSVWGFVICRRTLEILFCDPSPKTIFLFSLASFYLFFGPLPAFLPLTVRPDMAAVIFELLAFCFFVKEIHNQPVRAAMMATLFAFIAWSFKQVNISVFLSLLIFCFIHQRRAAMLMCFMMGAFASFVLWLGGPAFRAAAIFNLPIPGFSPRLALINMLYYFAECGFAMPGYLAILTAAISGPLRNRIQQDKVYQLCFIAAIVTFLYGLMTSFKIGASENYFIPASIFATVFFLQTLFLEKENAPFKIAASAFPSRNDPREKSLSSVLRGAFYFSLAVNAFLIFVILLGIKGNISKRDEHKEALELLNCAQSLPRPMFSQTVYLNLPWMLNNPLELKAGIARDENGSVHSKSFIPGYTYWVEKDREKVYEKGGIEGLIREGYFASLILERGKLGEIVGNSSSPEERLSRYIESSSANCPPGHIVFVKRAIEEFA